MHLGTNLHGLEHGPPIKASIRRAKPALDPTKPEQAQELQEALDKAKDIYDQTNEDAFHALVEMANLDKNPSLLAEFKELADTMDGRGGPEQRAGLDDAIDYEPL